MANTLTISPSCRLCRREGEKLFLKGDRCNTSKCAIVKRKYSPGVHGVKQAPRLSEYGQQLRAKQKAKRIYGVMERQFVNYYKKALQMSEDSELALMRLLDMRFDNVVFRLGYAMSRAQARQMVSHGHFYVNNKRMDIPSYQVRIGDEISVVPKSKDMPLFRDLAKRLEHQHYPSWLMLDASELKGKVLSMPTHEDLAGTIQAKQIVEFYSRF